MNQMNINTPARVPAVASSQQPPQGWLHAGLRLGVVPLAVMLSTLLGISTGARAEETAATAEAMMHANSLSKAFRNAA